MTPARYRVLRRLGKGGMGSVYLALHLAEHNFRQQVALKVLLPEADDVAEFEVRLRDEARVLGWLRHAGIVRADRLTRIDGRWAVVMEYVEGIDLHGLLRSVRPPLRAAIEIVLGAAQALRAAWETLEIGRAHV